MKFSKFQKLVIFFFQFWCPTFLGGSAQPRDRLGSTWTQNKSCREFFSACLRLSNFFEKSAVLAGESGTFILSGFLMINRFSVKSKVVLLDKWHISGKTEFCEKVPFSPGESGTFKLSSFLVINQFPVKSKVALLDKWHISCKTEF